MAGFLHGLLDAGEGWRGEAASSRAAIARACRRGDLLAALSMARFGDLSDVSGGALRAAEARWAGVTAQLNASGAGGGGVVVGGGGEGASGAAPPQRFAPFHAAAASVFERFGRTRLVPVVSLASPEAAEPVARALLRGGVDVMELVLRTPSAMQALRLIASKVPEMAVGAGTVLSAEQAEQAVAAGASFLVSPGTAAISTHLTTSHHTSSARCGDLAISPHISPHLPTSPQAPTRASSNGRRSAVCQSCRGAPQRARSRPRSSSG